MAWDEVLVFHINFLEERLLIKAFAVGSLKVCALTHSVVDVSQGLIVIEGVARLAP